MSAPVRAKTLPAPVRRGLSRDEAAAYVGVSPNTFDRLVMEGRMPAPAQVYGRKVYDLRALDGAFDRLQGVIDVLPDPTDSAQVVNPWD